MTSNQSHNQYLDQVVQQQEQLASELRSKRSAPMPAPTSLGGGPSPGRAARAFDTSSPDGEGGMTGSNAVEVRISGFGGGRR